jgi:hypothetical protein
MAFEVPKANKPQTFQYVADLGYGDRGLRRLRYRFAESSAFDCMSVGRACSRQ